MPKQTSGFIDKTIQATVSLLKETVSTEASAVKKGLVQKRDPRFKCMASALILVAIMLTKSIIVLCGFYVLILFTAAFSSLAISFFLKRTLLFVPLFSFCIIIPALFQIVTPGEPLVSFRILSVDICITRQGLLSATLVFMRVLCSVSLSVLVVLTTRHHVLLKVLRVFKVPQVFVMTMGMCYRYIFLFLDIIQKMFISIKSRVGFVSSVKTGRHIAAANMAGLWLQSYRMHSQVYDAMLSRGYTGDIRIMESFTATKTDFLFVIIAFLLLIGTVWINRFLY